MKWSKRINRPEKQICYLKCNFALHNGAGAPLETANRKRRQSRPVTIDLQATVPRTGDVVFVVVAIAYDEQVR